MDPPGIVRDQESVPAGEQTEIVGATTSTPSEDKTNREPSSEVPSKHGRSLEKQSVPPGSGTSLFAGLKRRDADLPEGLPERSTLPHQDSKERSVAPALHPATSSLYMRNFKRPLHLPTLRAIAYARGTRPSTIEALTVGIDDEETRQLEEEPDLVEDDLKGALGLPG